MKYVLKGRSLSEQAPCATCAWVEEPGEPTDRKLIPECRALQSCDAQAASSPLTDAIEEIVLIFALDLLRTGRTAEQSDGNQGGTASNRP
ncbi:hypothetical protein B9G55_00230 [Saccharibacillus sp. O16]|nr:hypothetical protein B9G55_00230 [Saccharibacillus sp. O16]